MVGVGSVGTRCWIALLLGRDDADPLFLQIKEAEPSVLEPFAGGAPGRQPGPRVVEGQQLMQSASDVFLGWLRVERTSTARRATTTSASCGTRRRSATIDTMPADELAPTARICGWTLARAHARSGDRVAIARQPRARRRVRPRARRRSPSGYADQNERDYDALAAAVKAGAVAAETGR